MNYLKRFEYVMIINECGSISKAANKLSISQPTLSKYLSNLEQELECELFDRTKTPLELTCAGEAFLQTGQKMLDLDSQLGTRLETLKNNDSLEITLGMSVSRSKYLMPLILSQYSKTNPKNRVLIKEGTTSQISESLTQGKLDMAISLLDEKTRQFENVVLFEERVLLAVPKSLVHKVQTALENNSEVDLRKLRDVPFISVQEGQYLRNALDLLLGEQVVPEYECQYIESALALSKMGIGVTLVPSYICDYDYSDADGNMEFYELFCQNDSKIQQTLNRKVCMFYRKDRFLSDAHRDLVTCCKDICAKA